ncbi:hypothetical protein FQR65_LT04430 [Abscondita terminalis]|nr:hypothetical protein FQR65_LT04430 [Abscondita terminalis]
MNFVILTVSDTCYAQKNVDLSGPKLEECIKEAFSDSCIMVRDILPDDQQMISQFLTQWSLKPNVDIILTTGGTGFSSRDVTPEATKAVIEKEASSISYAMISKSMQITDLAILSRAVCGIKYQTLIINLPGSAKGAVECFGFIKSVLPHAVAHLKDNRDLIKRDHALLQNVSQSKVKVNEVAFRNRRSPYPMLEVNKALEIIFSMCSKEHGTEKINIAESLYRVLAENIYANEPMPPFNASTKDGYAVKTADGAGIRTVVDVVAAGDTVKVDVYCFKDLTLMFQVGNVSLSNGEVVRVSTGAIVPPDADAVVQIEDTVLVKATPDGSKETEIEIKVAPSMLQDIRVIGSDIAKDELIIKAGDVINPGHIGVLATVGKTEVLVYKRPSVGIISTGNELQSPYEQLKNYHIRDSNKLGLLNLLKQYTFYANDCGIAKDNPNSVKHALTAAFCRYDVIITTGGVSMGEFDLIKKVLVEDFDATIHFGRINMKPGKPTTFATCLFENKMKMVFGLPGNPVSAMVTTTLFVIPTLRHLENNPQTSLPTIPVALGEDMPVDPRPEYVRVKLVHEGSLPVAYSVGNQISSKINSFANADALLLIATKDVHKQLIKKGEIFNAILLNTICN